MLKTILSNAFMAVIFAVILLGLIAGAYWELRAAIRRRSAFGEAVCAVAVYGFYGLFIWIGFRWLA